MARLHPYHPVVEALSRRPRLDGLPYDYVMSRLPGPPFYSRIPTRAEQEREEPDLAHHLKKVKGLERDPSFVPVPEGGATFDALLYGRPLPPLADDRPSDALVLGRAGVRSGFALVSHFEEDGRMFGVTTELRLLPLDRTRWIRPSAFQGLALDEKTPLPVGFVMKKRGAKRLTRDERGRMTPAGDASYREAIALTGRREGNYQEARDGTWLEAADLRVVGPRRRECVANSPPDGGKLVAKAERLGDGYPVSGVGGMSMLLTMQSSSVSQSSGDSQTLAHRLPGVAH